MKLEKKKITIKDIAKQAKVSETTISRYLNGKYEYMSAETKDNIENVIKKTDYRPSNIARTLKSKKSRLIGAIIADIENPFSTIVIKGLSDRSNELGYSLMIAISDNDIEKEQMYIQRFLDNGVDGLIINTVGKNEEYLKELKQTGFPMVLIDRGVFDNSIDTVTTNNYELGIEAMNHLFEMGYQSFAFFTGTLEFNTVRQIRYKAFSDKIKTNKTDHSKVYIIKKKGEKYEKEQQKKEIAKKLEEFRKLPSPRVVFAVNGLLLLTILEVMKQENYSIGEDFGVIGFDDWTWANVIGPGISTIAQDSYAIGIESCSLLVNRLNHMESSKEPIYKELPGKLMIRESTTIRTS